LSSFYSSSFTGDGDEKIENDSAAHDSDSVENSQNPIQETNTMNQPFLSHSSVPKASPTGASITVVSGLPRSGTSMMMKMLEAGGMELVVDQIRAADESNPKGYYEFERVKKLREGDYAWVEEAVGKTVKVISALLEHLPANYHYKVIFMERNMGEILASQIQMLKKNQIQSGDSVSDEKMAELYRKHLNQVKDWLSKQLHFHVLYTNYNDILRYPQENIERIANFLNAPLDIRAMLQTVDTNLYRQRR
jgi:hypothetical protein